MKLPASFLTSAALLALASCSQWPTQPPPRPLFGPGSAGGPFAAKKAPAQPTPWQAAPAPKAGPTWQGSTPSNAQSLGAGATLYEINAGGTQMEVVVFDSRQNILRVIDQPTPNAGGGVISRAMPYYRAIAGINGGFFHPDFSPLGLLIADGRKSGQFTDNKLLSGSVLVVSGEPYLVWNHEFLGEKGVTDLIQSGPRLIDGGQPIPKLEATKQAPRSFIANDGKRTWAIGVVRSTSLAGLAHLLASSAIPGMRVDRALNLDGGRSSAFWARTAAGREISQPGWSTVRDYLGVVPK